MSERDGRATVWLAGAAAAGALFALWLYGWRVVDPRSAAWLLQGDAAQHYMGSVFFRAEPWHWPPGMFTRYGEQPTSIVFTDAIPLLALITKLLQVPPALQYFGLWMVACHALSALFGGRLLAQLGVRSGPALLAGSLFFALSPALLLRAYGHESLMAHFILLLALSLALGPWRWGRWVALAVLSLLVHAYFVAMVGVIGACRAVAALAAREVRWAQLLGQGIVAAAALGATAWMAGYLGTASSFTAGGFNHFSSNLLTWFDPMDWQAFVNRYGMQAPYVQEWSRWLPPLWQATVGQYEGFAYLGAGMILLLALAVAVRWTRPAEAGEPVAPLARWLALAVATALLAMLALSAKPSLGPWFLFEVRLSERAYGLMSVFRASGRFIWPLTYLVMALAIAAVARRRWGAALVVAALVLQVSDLQPKLREFHTRFRVGPPALDTLVTDPLWALALARCPRVEIVSTHLAGSVGPAVAAGIAGATFSPAHVARPSPEAEERRMLEVGRRLKANEWRRDTVYVLADPLPGGLTVEQVVRSLPTDLRHQWPDKRHVVVAAGCLGSR